jgi:hypothetical protein
VLCDTYSHTSLKQVQTIRVDAKEE